MWQTSVDCNQVVRTLWCDGCWHHWLACKIIRHRHHHVLPIITFKGKVTDLCDCSNRTLIVVIEAIDLPLSKDLLCSVHFNDFIFLSTSSHLLLQLRRHAQQHNCHAPPLAPPHYAGELAAVMQAQHCALHAAAVRCSCLRGFLPHLSFSQPTAGKCLWRPACRFHAASAKLPVLAGCSDRLPSAAGRDSSRACTCGVGGSEARPKLGRKRALPILGHLGRCRDRAKRDDAYRGPRDEDWALCTL